MPELIKPMEYERAGNVNTPQYWNIAHKRGRTVKPRSAVVVRRLAEILADMPPLLVQEYGFGRYHLGMFVGPDRWVGYDFSEKAVQFAVDEGYTALVTRCRDARPPGDACVVALEVLEHLDHDEMMSFLQTASEAEHAFFSVPMARKRDLSFQQHMRSFGNKEDLADFLGTFWPSVTVELVRPYWRLAHCRRETS